MAQAKRCIAINDVILDRNHRVFFCSSREGEKKRLKTLTIQPPATKITLSLTIFLEGSIYLL